MVPQEPLGDLPRRDAVHVLAPGRLLVVGRGSQRRLEQAGGGADDGEGGGVHRRELRVDAHPAAQRVEAVAAGDHAHQQHHLGMAGDDRHLAHHLLGVLALRVEHPGDHEVHLAQRRHRGEGALDQTRVRREGDGAVLGHDAQPGTVRGAAQRGAERRRVGEDPDPRPEREALALDAVHDVQEVVHSPGLHDPGGVEHLVQGAPRQGGAAHVVAGRQM